MIRNARLLDAGRRPEETVSASVTNALLVSIVIHAIGVAFAVLVATRVMGSGDSIPHVAPSLAHITWIAQPSPEGDGGGGSGDHALAPPRPMQRPGTDAVSVPTRSSAALPDKASAPEPVDIPALPTSAGIQDVVGVITTLASTAIDSGPGTGGRQGNGRGPGLGQGDGAGTGPGSNNGPGAGGYRPGNGVTLPRLIREVKPGYTGEAMRARIQGVVRLQAIVLPDGSVGTMKIVRSLDNTFGLDDEALKTVQQWRFQPGTLAGRAVPVLIEVELAFTLR